MKKRDTLLIVDDMEVNRAILRSLFERQYNLLEAENGEQALLLLHEYEEHVAAMLLDLVMPVKDGYEVMEEMGKSGLVSRIPVIVITSDDTAESEVRAFDLGAADIIMKPFEPHVVKRRVQNAVELCRHKLHLEELVEEQSASLRESNAIMIDALSSIIEYRSVESGQHIRRIRMFTKILLEDVAKAYQEYNLDSRTIEIIADASSMHDIGKIAIPDSILNKPGPLTREEFEVMKTHTTKGCEMLSGLERMNDKEYIGYAYNICRYHHERWNGKGYPDGLKGDNIPICAQVVAIADCYDALTTDRVYKKALPAEQAFNMILNGECGEFSPRLLECFKNVREDFAALSRAYADGVGPKFKPERKELRKPETIDAVNTMEQGQMKYLTLLRYVDSTVMEVDLNTGIYHVVYMPNRDFELLRSGSRFEDSVRAFAQGSVYPDDRGTVLGLLGDYMTQFFSDGLMKRTRKYRVLDQTSGAYYWCYATLLRVDIGNPGQKKAMLVWHRASDEQQEELLPGTMKEGMYRGTVINRLAGGVVKCRNDKWYTLADNGKGLCDLICCTEQDLSEKYHNRYLEIIFPADRDRVSQEMVSQLEEGRITELEYRLVTEEGKLIWVMDRSILVTEEDGLEYIYTLLVDVTQSHKAMEELQMSVERYKIILDQTKDVIFEWEIATDEISYSSNWEHKYGYQPILDGISRRLPFASHINPDDIPDVLKFTNDMMTGRPFGEVEFRLANSEGRYCWCRVRATTQFDTAGKPRAVVGIITDIDGEKRATEKLIDRAERDVLTKLYNKRAARHKINRFLELSQGRECSAMLMIDVDNFKLVNDRYGHMFGDAVLTEMASRISSHFRDCDIVSRIGGDEFMVFMPGIGKHEIAMERAERLMASFQTMFKSNLKDVPFSCSIGIAYSPEDGSDFQSLFQNSDAALYQAKLEGKNRCMQYCKSAVNTAFEFKEEADRPEDERESAEQRGQATVARVISMTFQELYDAADFDQAMNSILEMTGRLFHVSRVYIFENCADSEERCTNTFEWCREGIRPQRDELRNLSYGDMGGDYRDNFNEEGVFYCLDITELTPELQCLLADQGIASVLQCSITADGVFKGFVGFDECGTARIWTQEQVDCLVFLSKMVSTFLLKKRAEDRVRESMQNLERVLNNQNSWIYVIDGDTYELRYINEKTHRLAPESRLGICCYDAFFHRDKPCERCPVRECAGKGSSAMEIYNPVLKVWTLADSSRIRWGDRDAFLLACHDISPYKVGEAVEGVTLLNLEDR